MVTLENYAFDMSEEISDHLKDLTPEILFALYNKAIKLATSGFGTVKIWQTGLPMFSYTIGVSVSTHGNIGVSTKNENQPTVFEPSDGYGIYFQTKGKIWVTWDKKIPVDVIKEIIKD